MSLITRCPACGTMFKVVADQLKVSQGWVRCGQCTDVFDASTHMVASGEAMSPQPSSSVPPTLPPPQADHVPVDAPAASSFSAPPESEPLAVATPADAPLPTPAPHQDDFDPVGWKEEQQARMRQDVPAFFAQAAAEDQPPPRPQLMRTEALADVAEGAPDHGAQDMSTPPEPAALTLTSSETGPLAGSAPDATADQNSLGDGASSAETLAKDEIAKDADKDEDEDEDQEAAHPAPDVSFVREARRQAFWKQRKVRVGLALLSLLLVAGLVFQWALHQRDTLAAQSPKLAPWLQTACGWLHCELRAPRHIESLVIDGSTFSKIGADAYRLSFTLKNTGATLVHIPSLELTLTDAQDQPVVRRVLAPAQFGVNARVMAAQSELAGLVTLRVPPSGSRSASTDGAAPSTTSSASAAPLRVAGYRVLAFYPD